MVEVTLYFDTDGEPTTVAIHAAFKFPSPLLLLIGCVPDIREIVNLGQGLH